MKVLILFGSQLKLGWGRSVKVKESLEKMGHSVQYLEYPKIFPSSYKKQIVENGFCIPTQRFPLFKPLVLWLQKNRVSYLIEQMDGVDFIFWYSPLFPELHDWIKDKYPRVKTMLDVPDYRSSSYKIKGDYKTADLLDSQEKDLVELCDYVSVINKFHLERLSLSNKKKVIIENGVDVLSDSIITNKSKSMVYIGGINYRVDLKALDEFLLKYNQTIELYGPIEEKLRKNLSSRMIYKGVVPQEKIPMIISHYEYGVLPYNKCDFNTGSQPLKILQYLSHGLKVIDFSGIASQYNLKGIMEPRHFKTSNETHPDINSVQMYSWNNQVSKILAKIF